MIKKLTEKSVWLICIIGLISLSQCTTSQSATDSGVSEIPELPEFEPVGDEPQIVVVDFENHSFFDSERVGYAVSTMFTNALINSRRFRVVDRQNLNKIMDEYKKGMQGITQQDVSTIGEQLGVDYIVGGAVTEFGVRRTGGSFGASVVDRDTGVGGGTRLQTGEGTARLVCDIRITKVSTGEIIYAGSAEGSSSSNNAVFGLEMLMDDHAASIQVGGGVQGFDETLGGMAARKAAERLLYNLVSENIF